ncbi:MAG: hypothetical protein NZM65_07630 [Flavobacteriales bacterium]|nr:hypothetical protein [Flavobacteriales bacterium]MDW8410543.1 hypothetical protein [Flavobacteriales bacterium]
MNKPEIAKIIDNKLITSSFFPSLEKLFSILGFLGLFSAKNVGVFLVRVFFLISLLSAPFRGFFRLCSRWMPDPSKIKVSPELFSRRINPSFGRFKSSEATMGGTLSESENAHKVGEEGAFCSVCSEGLPGSITLGLSLAIH